MKIPKSRKFDDTFSSMSRAFHGDAINSDGGHNPLFWIGIAMLACLVILTIVTVIDLRNDAAQEIKADILPSTPGYELSIAVCPNCNNQGVVQCFYCSGLMQWDALRNTFICSGCARYGSPNCPKCGMFMSRRGSQAQQVAAPFSRRFIRYTPNPAYLQPIAYTPPPGCVTCPTLNQCFPAPAGIANTQPVAFTPPPGCVTCPTLNQCFPNQAATQPAGFGTPPDIIVCPACGYSMSKQPGAPAYSISCPQCGGRMVRAQ